ncbi:class III extradiol dioxygenase subunit B-like domain-containing protein [Streptomyces sodiiphilus]|uniref:Class III extradiol dioxygenase subunit B-like domain-containing protein n=1 Tax=Streptomyces sodiiphilus TaxID=226217 RepID=A0ABP5AV80_9ACTN
MLVAAAVCPCPPLLVPEVAAGAAPELEPVRRSCAEALGVLAAARLDRLLVIGPAGPDEAGPAPAGTPGSFRGFGVDLTVRLGSGDAPPGGRELPASLAVGAWLLEHVGWSAAPVDGLAIDRTMSTGDCVATGRDIASRAGRLGLLVMGDGSICRSLTAPGHLDERAAGFDAAVARALGDADTAALAALDPGPAAELGAEGRPCWQVLAGAGEGVRLAGQLLHDEALYGVAYLTAVWS